jgi:O-acetyl-ADP-ribose deacetylase (regulator of RNase III)
MAGGEHHEARILEDAYRNCLRLAADNGYKTMAFPAISTGVWLSQSRGGGDRGGNRLPLPVLKPMPEQVFFVCFDEDTAHLYQRLLTQRGQEFDV